MNKSKEATSNLAAQLSAPLPPSSTSASSPPVLEKHLLEGLAKTGDGPVLSAAEKRSVEMCTEKVWPQPSPLMVGIECENSRDAVTFSFSGQGAHEMQPERAPFLGGRGMASSTCYALASTLCRDPRVFTAAWGSPAVASPFQCIQVVLRPDNKGSKGSSSADSNNRRTRHDGDDVIIEEDEDGEDDEDDDDDEGGDTYWNAIGLSQRSKDVSGADKLETARRRAERAAQTKERRLALATRAKTLLSDAAVDYAERLLSFDKEVRALRAKLAPRTVLPEPELDYLEMMRAKLAPRVRNPA